MTPTATRLQARLQQRRSWFYNEWFFKWHYIGGQTPVVIDTFDGRYARFGGIAFSGSAMDIYWEAIVRGVRKEIVEQFVWLDAEIRTYNSKTAFQAVDECAGQLVSWSRSVRNTAIEKDRILRGDGMNFPAALDSGHWDGTSDEEILAQANSLKDALPFFRETKRTRLLTYWNQNQWWLGPIALLLGLVGIFPLLF